jgi:hypothetical protein
MQKISIRAMHRIALNHHCFFTDIISFELMLRGEAMECLGQVTKMLLTTEY